jgi:hypothetical protein
VPAPSQLAPPAFLGLTASSLAFPAVDFRPTARATSYQGYIYAPTCGLLGMTATRRLLYWPQRNQGARELGHFPRDGQFCLGFDGTNTVYVLFVSGSSNEKLTLFTVSLHQPELMSSQDLSAALALLPNTHKAGEALVRDVIFGLGQRFYLRTYTGFATLHCFSGVLKPPVNQLIPPSSLYTARPGQLSSFINNGYNVLQRISRVGVNTRGELMIGNHALTCQPGDTLELQANKLAAATQPHTTHFADNIYALLPNPLIRFQWAAWADGSEAIADSRGLLHLRSANPHLPEITLLLVLGKPTAAWAPDGSPHGVVCGAGYFTQGSPARRLSVVGFYQQYIQPFIDHIIAS